VGKTDKIVKSYTIMFGLVKKYFRTGPSTGPSTGSGPAAETGSGPGNIPVVEPVETTGEQSMRMN